MSAGWLGTSWGLAESSVVARHEWKGLSKMSYNLEDYDLKARLEAEEMAHRPRVLPRRERATMMAMPGSFVTELLDDEI